jgi:uncharacterized membrane protein (UPF0127 family)
VTPGAAAWQALRAVDDGRTICRRVRWAGSFGGRFVGLMGRSTLADDEGLYLPGTNGVHMFFMRFPIDCLFLSRPAPDGTQRVVGVRSRLMPWRGVVWRVPGAAGVVELPSGTLANSGIQHGDIVRFDSAG